MYCNAGAGNAPTCADGADGADGAGLVGTEYRQFRSLKNSHKPKPEQSEAKATKQASTLSRSRRHRGGGLLVSCAVSTQKCPGILEQRQNLSKNQQVCSG